MSLPGNGIFVVKGEISIVLTAMRRGSRWSSHHPDDEQDPLIKGFQDLREVLNSVEDLRRIDPVDYLNPFLKVIRSEDTTGPITSLALSAVNKFLSYGLIDPVHASVPQTVQNVADAVTHARFVGTDQSSDGVVLMKILQVLKTLTLSPEGAALTNESLCDIMLSCFRICFETRLNELLRRTAEYYLREMIQLVFMRLPQFPEVFTGNFKLLKMRPGNIEQTRLRKRNKGSSKAKKNVERSESDEVASNVIKASAASDNIVDMQGSISQEDSDLQAVEEEAANDRIAKQETDAKEDFVNQRGITFTNQHPGEMVLIPYGLACVYELFRFLISLCNPLDKQNTDVMIHLGLALLTTAFEVGADSIGKYGSLLALVKDDLCRNLFALLSTDRLSVFTADLQLSFLMFEALRTHLKFQLEHYLTKLMEIIVSDAPKVTYEHKEIALDNILQLWRIPNLTTELYLNYDCDMYCSNLYEDLTKLLAKNAFPHATRGIHHTHLLSLDALLTVIDGIASRCRAVAGSVSRQRTSDNVPTRNDLLAVKCIKKWLPTGTEYFNQKPKKGIQFLQEQGVLSAQLDVREICVFLRENPGLDKKMIGEYISGRANLAILEEFVKMFDFGETRIDEALRMYLETFRLPGEAPLISLLMEHFAEHWHKCNGEPFANADAAFTLAYAVIMLNVDQHNQNVKRQNNPMTAEGFKKNLTKVNGGSDFDQEMLDEIYNAISSDEIVMPAEQTGIVRDNYMWKVLLRRGASKDGRYVHVTGGAFDADLFSLISSPVLGALSAIFDKAEDASVYRHAIGAFERCAFISAHYAMNDNVDVLIATLAKYTLLDGQMRNADVTVQFGASAKAQLALKTIFELAHQHGQSIWKGWSNLCDLILTLYMHGMLPKCYVEAEDFIDKSGRIALVYEAAPSQKQDSSLLSSLYSYVGFSENQAKAPSQEESVCIQRAKDCIVECNLEALITDSKFLHADTLLNLVHWLTEWSRGPDVEKSLGYSYNENVTVFFLELLVKVVLLNRDRVLSIWQNVRVHLYTLVMNASHCDYQFLLERTVIGLLRLAIRLMRNEEMSPIVLQSLRMLLLLKANTLYRISRQISFGLYELLKTSAQNIHTSTDWSIIFTLLECVGAGAQPPKPIADESQAVVKGAKSESEMQMAEDDAVVADRGYASDSDLNKCTPTHNVRSQSPIIVPVSPIGSPHNNSGGWILVGNEGEVQPIVGRTPPAHEYNLHLERNLGAHDAYGLVKCCESLAFLVRDVAHITPYNFDNCVHCIRTFVEASLYNSKKQRDSRGRQKHSRRGANRTQRSPASSPDEEESDEEVLPGAYHQVTFQLLDLMHTLHTRTAQIFKWWAEESGELATEISLWTQGWCPLLQGIARLCCDPRKEVRTQAITYLQRALLVHDLQTLTGPEWAACFNRVLFPLLNQLLQPVSNAKDLAATEETRMRAATVLSKVFLHHLTPLLSLDTFPQLWLTILEYMDRYMHADKSDLLAEAIPESLKNMLLVMESAGVFINSNTLWLSTWERINKFLPGLKDELFKEKEAKGEGMHVKEEYPKSTIHVTQQNIENATRSSIILQPPHTSTIKSPLFAHLGQMVSTPIGPPTIVTDSVRTLPVSAEVASMGSPSHITKTSRAKNTPTSPTMVSNAMQSFLPATQTTHTFPILYAPANIPTTTDEVPVTLYTEFTNDPYNFPSNTTFRNYLPHDTTLSSSPNYNNNPPSDHLSADLNSLTNLHAPSSNSPEVADVVVEEAIDVQALNQFNNDNGNNVFRSSNYFANNDCDDIPPGSEILFTCKLPLDDTLTVEPITNVPIASPQPIGSQYDM